jgi:CHAD domain-containing protein
LATEFSTDAASVQDAPALVAESAAARIVESEAERRVWLDTYDWSLFRAGLLLEQRTRGADATLVLSDLAGNPVGRTPVGKRPVSERSLPAGPIADRVLPLTGIRALLPRLAAEGPTSLLAVLDVEEKTVVRIAVDGPFVADGVVDAAVTRVRVEPLRGYDPDATRVAKLLAATPGLIPAGSTLFASLAVAGGLKPGAFRSKPDSKFAADTPAGAAFADTLGQLLGIVRDNLDGTLRELDTEFLHDLRVAVRRARSVLKASQGVVTEEWRGHWSGELKWLGDATSTPRDLDVQLLDFGPGLSTEELANVEPFRSLLERWCRRSHSQLNRALRSQRFTDLLSGWERDLARPGLGPTTAVPVGRVARDLLSRTWAKVGKMGGAITPDSPAENLHDLRKRCKELRYLLEFFACLYDARTYKALIDELKVLQDNLGGFQDFEAQWFLVRDCATELRGTKASIECLLTMGAMGRDLRHRQDAAREDFAARWATFHGQDNRKRFADMVATQ